MSIISISDKSFAAKLFRYFRAISLKGFCFTMANLFKAYCEKSSIDGISYIAKRNFRIEKLFWVTALVVSCICCGFMIYEIGEKLQEDAMVTYTSDTAIAVTDVSCLCLEVFG
jgi:peptidoglycan/LPS O-acetylase OafA/YrhL